MAMDQEDYYSSSNYSYSSIWDYFTIPLPLCFFGIILFLMLGFSWYINYESMFEDLAFQLKLFLIISPLILLLLVHVMSSGDDGRLIINIPFLSMPERDSLHRAGGSPWGVAAVLVLLMVMVSNRSAIHERWFPLLAK